MLETMYSGIVNSPATSLTAAIDNVVTSIEVDNGVNLPDPPNICTIGKGENAETILYETKVGNILGSVTRGYQGIAQGWTSGTQVARFFTEYDYNTLKENITIINNNLTNPETPTTVPLTTESPVASTSTPVENGQATAWEVEGSFRGNIFNKNAGIVEGSYLDASGNITANALYFYDTDYVKVKPSTTYTASSGFSINTYDTSKVWESNITTATFTTSATQEYIRVSGLLTELDTFMIEEGTVLGSYIQGIQPTSHVEISCVGKNQAKEINDSDYDLIFPTGGSITNKQITLDLSAGTGAGFTSELFKVKRGTNYTYSVYGKLTSGTPEVFLQVLDSDGNTLYQSATEVLTGGLVRYSLSFDTLENNNIKLKIVRAVTTGIALFEKIQLELGTAPTEYKPYVISKYNDDSMIGEGDKLTGYVDGRVEKYKKNEFVDYFGALDWEYSTDYVGYKRFVVFDAFLDGVTDTSKVVKYDSKIVKTVSDAIFTEADYNVLNAGDLYISIADTDSGWGEAYTPLNTGSDLEIQAMMNMWVMHELDETIYDAGTKYWSKRYQGLGTPLTLGFGAVVESGTAVTVCPTTKAYGEITQGYKMFYGLATPVTETITTGNAVNTFSGEKNTFSVESGMVYGELATPVLDSGYYKVNDTTLIESTLNKKAKTINKIIKETFVDGEVVKSNDTANWTIDTTTPYGNQRAIILEADYDTTANYLFDSEILHSEYDNQQTYVDISYKQNTHDAINSLNQNQNRIDNQVGENTKRIGEQNLINLEFDARITVLEP